jgi:UDP-glucose 4-epimerase
MNVLRYGPNKSFVKFSVTLSWPLMKAAKILSNYPVVKWIINPFFAYPYNEITSVPINVAVPAPDSVAIPNRIIEKLVLQAADIFILDECICRGLLKCTNHPPNIGCMALGKAADRMHPSHGHHATKEEAVAHIRKAAEAGLVANVAHTWIDPVAFGLTRFNRLMFICFCDDCCCLYRTHMKNRGPNLDKACKSLPGLSIIRDEEKCNACMVCADNCFVAAVQIVNDRPVITEACKGCGRCVANCSTGALSISLADEDLIFQRMMERINQVADIT